MEEFGRKNPTTSIITPVRNTVWKFHDFSITQILREINFGDSRSFMTAIFAILEALNFDGLVNFSLQKLQMFIKSKLRHSGCVKIADFAILESQKFDFT